MKIDKSQTKVIFEFTPERYFLCKLCEEDRMYGDYSLNLRIDRSYKGKDDDVGMPIIYLLEEEAKICRENGFEEIGL